MDFSEEPDLLLYNFLGGHELVIKSWLIRVIRLENFDKLSTLKILVEDQLDHRKSDVFRELELGVN